MKPIPNLSPQDYALQRMREAMAADDVRAAAFWLGVLAQSDHPAPESGTIH